MSVTFIQPEEEETLGLFVFTVSQRDDPEGSAARAASAGFTSCCHQAEPPRQRLIRLENTAKPQLPVERRRPVIKLFIYNAEISRCPAFHKPQTQMAEAALRLRLCEGRQRSRSGVTTRLHSLLLNRHL